MATPSRVTIVEVGPRDGFQMETTFIPTELKIAVIDRLAEAGISKIEATSFVSPKVIPQMEDAALVMQGLHRRPGVTYSVLVPNDKGARRAVEAQADAMRVVICASETYNRRNVGMSVSESLENCRKILDLARSNYIQAEAIVALAFGCPLEGDVPEDRVLALAGKLAEMGYSEISIADSIGLASPRRVLSMMRRLGRELPDIQFSMHIHNTRGLGLANVLAALEEGIHVFDSSLGGLGGCPVVPGGSGNIPTEDLVYMLDEMGIATGVDVEKVMVASQLIGSHLGRSLPSYVLRSGTRQHLFRGIRESTIASSK